MRAKLSSLTLTGVILRIIRKSGFLSNASRNILRSIASRNNFRKILNKLYNKLNYDERSVFHTIFYNIFRNDEEIKEDGYWNFWFSGKIIKLPIRKNMIWLDWEHIVSFLGHNIEVKETYETFIRSGNIKVFFDIGANYGLHSLLFLSQNIETISFEPNPACKIQFNEYCRINNFEGRMETVAIGEVEKKAELWFPEKETWLGTVDENTKKENYLLSKNLTKIIVPMINIDQFVNEQKIYPDLIKIDAEGYEYKIILGAIETIKTKLPIIIFECNALNSKNDLWKIFKRLHYDISSLPVSNISSLNILDQENFLSHKDINFIAIPSVK